MESRLAIEPEWLKEELEKPGRSQSALARFMKLGSAAIVNRMCKGAREISAKEADQIRAYLAATARNSDSDHIGNTPDLPPEDPIQDYVTVEVLPTFAGMGGGGTGDADQVRALLPRALIEDDLRGRADDFLLINLRGNSMVPDFHHGDQVVIDKRDRNPVQPGPFALWDGDGYVVKNVERRRGKYRVFSSNKDYSEIEYEPEDVQIMGRTVWYARRL